MFFTISPDISCDLSRGGLSTFLARHVRLATAGVFLRVEDRGPKHNAARERLRLPQQNRMKYVGSRLPLILFFGCLGVVSWPLHAQANDGPKMAIVLGHDAPTLEQFAADQAVRLSRQALQHQGPTNKQPTRIG